MTGRRQEDEMVWGLSHHLKGGGFEWWKCDSLTRRERESMYGLIRLWSVARVTVSPQ